MVRAAVVPVACDYLEIANAIASVNAGDRIEIASGNCMMTNAIIAPSINFTLAGSGTNLTTLVSTNTAYCIRFPASSSVVVTDLNCVGSSANTVGFFDALGYSHFARIQMTNLYYRGISLNLGLVENSVFIHAGGSAQSISFVGAGYESWESESPLGTTNVACVEDCYFNANGAPGNGYFDGYSGASLLFRNNFCDGYTPSGVHGYDSGQISARTWEIYGNIFTNYPSGLVLHLRGGTGVIYGNQVFGGDVSTLTFAAMAYYRSCMFTYSYIHQRGVPGFGMNINFDNVAGDDGYSDYFDGQPTNGATIFIGGTRYGFTNAYHNSSSVYGFPGGWVVTGSTVAETITNFFNCINLSPIGAGTNYSASTVASTEFVAIDLSETSLVLTNILDSNTDGFGYPANQQLGVLQSFEKTSTNFVNDQVVWPIYAWDNTTNAGSVNLSLLDNNANCNYYITNLVKLNRDYFETEPSSEVYAPLVYPHPLSSTLIPHPIRGGTSGRIGAGGLMGR